MRFGKNVVLLGITALFLAGPVVASANDDCLGYASEAGCGSSRGYYDGYDESQAHPLRLVAYAFHPVGYAVEWLVTRPIHAIVSQPELERVFGHRPHSWDLCCGVEKPVEAVTAPPPAVASTADVDAARRAAEEAKAAAEEARRAAEEAARAAEKSTRGFEKGLRK